MATLSKSDAKAVKKAGIAGGLSSSQASGVVSKTNAGATAAPQKSAGLSTTSYGIDKKTGKPVGPGNDPRTGAAAGLAPSGAPESPTEALGPEIAPPTTPATNPQGMGLMDGNISTITDPQSGQQFTRDTSIANSVYQKKQQQLQQMRGTGAAPSEGGLASMGMQQNLAQEQDTTAVDNFVSTDPGVNNLFKGITDLLNAQNQSSTLMQDYKKLYRESGLDDINEELIDADTVINGTEDDIRNEIQTAGGFGTDSQVQAMALSRNKGLLKRYNQLVQMKTDATNQLNTLTSLNAQDKQIAQQRVNTQISTMFNMANFAQQAQNNVREQARWLTTTMGADGLYDSLSKDPKRLANTEQILGLAPGGLSSLATQARTQRVAAAQMQDLDIQYKKAQIKNIYSDIDARKAANTVTVDQQGRAVVTQPEALKVNKELTSSDSYKAIRKGQDSLQFLKQFEDTFKQTGATSAVFSPRENAKLKAQYNAAILNLKEFFNLGVLNGPDEEILKGVLPEPNNRSALLTIGSLGIYNPASATQAGLESMKNMISSTIDDRYKSLKSQYGGYSPQSVTTLNDLDRIYLEQKAQLDPRVQQMINENPGMTMDDALLIIQ